MRDEEAAALAATSYAKFSEKLGICFATAAPGTVHLLNGFYDAKIDQAPVLAISGMTYRNLIGTNSLGCNQYRRDIGLSCAENHSQDPAGLHHRRDMLPGM